MLPVVCIKNGIHKNLALVVCQTVRISGSHYVTQVHCKLDMSFTAFVGKEEIEIIR